jgi:FkbM family methyltransferase
MKILTTDLPGALRKLDAPVDHSRDRVRRVVVSSTSYGQMMVNRFDSTEGNPGVGGQLLATGQFDPDEMVLLRNLVAALRPDPVVLDIGANIGVDTLVMAYECEMKNGTVYAFEPQRQVFQMLCGNVALNSLDNVHCLNQAVGSEPGKIPVPRLDYNSNASFGSLELGQPQKEDIGQDPDVSDSAVEMVEVCTIDGMKFDRIDLIKLDVEGMEIAALQGAKKSLARFKPLLHIEWIKSDKHLLVNFLEDLGYEIRQFEQNYVALPQGWSPEASTPPTHSRPAGNDGPQPLEAKSI